MLRHGPRWAWERRSDLFVLIGVAAALVVFGELCWLANRSLDVSDEGFYLNWLRDPWLYDASTSLFGFLYHPLYEFVDGDLADLRRANVAFTAAIGTGLAFAILRAGAQGRAPRSRTSDVAVSFVASVSFCAMYNQWLPTPSYNWLSLHGLGLATTGLVLAMAHAGRSSGMAGGVAAGVGLWLCFLAKPTTAALAAVLMLAVLLVVSWRRWWTLVVGLFTTLVLLLATALLVDGSVGGFRDRLQAGADDTRLLGSGYAYDQLLRMDELEWSPTLRLTFVLLAALGFLLVSYRGQRGSLATFVAFVALAATTVWVVIDGVDDGIRFERFQALLAAAIPLGGAVAILLTRHATLRRGTARPLVAIAIVLALLPYVYIFGSNNNYWHGGAYAGGFWTMALLALLAAAGTSSRAPHVVLLVLLASQVVTAALVQAGAHAPYRQSQSAYEMTHEVSVPGSAAHPKVGDADAAFLTRLQRSARTAGIDADTPVIDMTGRSPGLVYVLGARAIGSPWMIGGYPGSRDLAEVALERVACREIAAAWILDEPGGTRDLPLELLGQSGIEERDLLTYEEFALPNGGRVRLRLPDRDHDDGLRACESARD